MRHADILSGRPNCNSVSGPKLSSETPCRKVRLPGALRRGQRERLGQQLRRGQEDQDPGPRVHRQRAGELLRLDREHGRRLLGEWYITVGNGYIPCDKNEKSDIVTILPCPEGSHNIR